MTAISKPQKKFIVVLLTTILLLRGKMNFRNLSRYSTFCEKTFSRQFANSFDFPAFNQILLTTHLSTSGDLCATMDASFVPKSGKHTYGGDFFFNSVHTKAEKGLEISTLAVIDQEANTGFTISARQTPTQADIQTLLHTDPTSDPDETRIDFYLYHLRLDRQYLSPSIRYILTDGYFTKIKFTNGVIDLGFHQIGKLRHDARLQHLYTGPQKPRGAKRKYDGKVKFNDLSRLQYVAEVDPNIHLYTAVVNSINLKRNIRIAFLVNRSNPDKPKYVILFSTDINIDPILIYQYYKSRFQIEFIFRDAKQFTGLCDCQARDKNRLNFHFNASLTALNLAKIDARNSWDHKQPFTFSMNSIKTQNFNAHLIDTFISMFDLDSDLIKNHQLYDKLLTYGAIHT